tara:strand:+ start:2452 stop:2742 length:291 start_codon:yes stop_codon:yes gene_type:complete
MSAARPLYEALDKQGMPYIRPAKTVGELPHSHCRAALDKAIESLSDTVRLTHTKPLAYGMPVYHSFGLNHREAARHIHAKLLMTKACDLNLDFVRD